MMRIPDRQRRLLDRGELVRNKKQKVKVKHHLRDAQGVGSPRKVRQLSQDRKRQTITRDMVSEKGVESILNSVHVVRIMFKESKSPNAIDADVDV